MKKYCLLILLCCINLAVMASPLSTLGGGGTPAGSICVPKDSAVIYNFNVNQTGGTATLSAVNFTTTGVYSAPTDVTAFRLWYSTTNVFSTAHVVDSVFGGLGSGLLHTFAPTVSLFSGGTSYFWITADCPGTATPGDNIAVNSIAHTDITVSTGSVIGSAGAGSSQTLNPQPAIPVMPTTFICQGSDVSISDATVGGTWSSSNPSIAYVNTSLGSVVIGIGLGPDIISYTIGGCSATISVSVNNVLPAIVPTTPIRLCMDSTLTLTNPVPGVTWSSTTTSVATIGSTTGVLTGVAGGYDSIICTLTGTICSSGTPINVDTLPLPIVGPTSVCAGNQNSVTLTDATAGGTWSSTNVTVGTTGIVQGTVAGTVGNIVYYTLSDGCAAMIHMTINPLPATITGQDTVCASEMVTLHETFTNGIWGSSNITVATIDSAGDVLGLTNGTTTITFTDTLTTCYTTIPFYVRPFGPIIDSPNICYHVPTQLLVSTGGGLWTASPTTIATINPVTGVITGLGLGTVFVTYSIAGGLSSGCISTDSIHVDSLPSPISPSTAAICANQTFTFTDPSSTTAITAIWTNKFGTVSHIDSFSGIDSGIAVHGGIDTVFYTNTATHCKVAAVITVNAVPDSITGSHKLCIYSSTVLRGYNIGSSPGTWSISNPAIASISPYDSAVTVTGLTVGVDTITYSLGACPRIFIITVNPLPNVIVGPDSMCALYTMTLTDATGPGVWTSVHSGVATVGALTGVVTAGNVSGTRYDSIIYTMDSTGCSAVLQITVNPIPNAITGTAYMCVSNSATLAETSTGGAWSSAHTGIATVDGSGVVTGVTAGTDTISYTIPFTIPMTTGPGCPATIVVTINPAPAAIAGASFDVCTGSTLSLSDDSTGGVWTSSNVLVATVDGSGNVFGVSTIMAIDTITYTISASGCYIAHAVTVYPLPAPIVYANPVICSGVTITLTDSTFGGSWASSNPTVGYIPDGLTGVVTGINAGTAIITYTTAAGCPRFDTLVVNPIPDTIFVTSGDPAYPYFSLCAGFSISVYDSTRGTSVPGGTFTLSNTYFATVVSGISTVVTDLSGDYTYTGATVTTNFVSSVDTVYDTLYYTFTGGCSTFRVLTIYPTPVENVHNICFGSIDTFTALPAGGTWFIPGVTYLTELYPSPVTDASSFVVVQAIGVVDGTYILYSYGGCTANNPITVNPTPSGIVGPDSICAGVPTFYNDPDAGGVWNTIYNLEFGYDTMLSVVDDGGGLASVTGIPVTGGFDSLIYTFPVTGCRAVFLVSVNPLSPIIGDSVFCLGDVATMIDTTASGGTWASTFTTIATISDLDPSSGLLDAVGVGAGQIYFTVNASGCIAYKSITVNPNPDPITGGDSVCFGSTLSLSDDIVPGIWSSADGTIAPIDASTGIVTGLALGVTTITYTATGTSCYTTEPMTVNPVSPIVGPSEICYGVPTVYTDLLTGGSWAVSSTSLGLTVNPISGIATGGTPGGVDSILYTILPSGCVVTKVVSVNTIDSIIHAYTTVCVGGTTTFSDATGGGTWSSANTGIATIGTYSGIVTGIAPGTVTITYSISTGCFVIVSLIVNEVTPIFFTDAIGDTLYTTDTICEYLTSQVYDSTSGGLWSSGDTNIFTVSPSGVITAKDTIASTEVYYTLPTGCVAHRSVYIIGIPPINQDSLNTILCAGDGLTLVDTPLTGTPTSWTSSNTAIATVTGIGPGYDTALVVAGSIPGAVTITYTASTYGHQCISKYNITVNPAPSPIIAPDSMCAWGATALVTDASTGGIWSATLISVDNSTDIVTTAGPGTGTLTYTLPTGCFVTKIITVNPLPAAIGGPTNICAGISYTYTDATTPIGTWSVGGSPIATINPTVALTTHLFGLDSGLVILTYTLATGCNATKTISINPNSPIIGSHLMCVGVPVLDSNKLHGGIWSVTPIGTTTITPTVPWGNSAYVVSSLPGVIIIKYTMPGSLGCSLPFTATVNPLPGVISPNPISVCAGDSVQVFDIPGYAGGYWSTSDSAVATLSPAGAGNPSTNGWVKGIGAGTDTISYTYPTTGCSAIEVINVKSNGPILPLLASNLCAGVTATLSDTAAAGNWAIGATWTILNTGIVTSMLTTTGDSLIITPSSDPLYLFAIDTVKINLANGCVDTLIFTINPQPNPIAGPTTVCAGSQITLIEPMPGGSWSSTNTSAATIPATPVIAGGGAVSGTVTASPFVTVATVDTIYYTMLSHCFEMYIITINPLPLPIYTTPIAGVHHVCATDSLFLNDATPFGFWTMDMTALGTINAGTGQLNAYGGYGGVVNITYTLPTSCYITYPVTINPLALIEGPDRVCQGIPTVFIDTIHVGTWTSDSVAIASVGLGTGTVTGHISGVRDTIFYTMAGTGCRTFHLITVNPSPGTIIEPPSSVCVGQSVTLTDLSVGGIWTSHDTARATIDSFTGVVSGIATGTVIITYSFGTGCYVVNTIIVNPLAPIVEVTPVLPPLGTVCYGHTIYLADAIPSVPPGSISTWTSSNTSIATVAQVSLVPGPDTAMLTATGTWATGGVVTITYTTHAGCKATKVITVNPNPRAIIFPANLCLNDTANLITITGGGVINGVWTINVPLHDTIIPNNIPTTSLYTLEPGTVIITYTDIITTCDTSKLFTVNPIPDSIKGLFNVCLGASTTVTDAPSGGLWLQDSPPILGLNTLLPYKDTVIVTGLAVGTTTITYMLPAGCQTTHLFEVLPVADPTITLSASLGDTITTLLHDIICFGQHPDYSTSVTNEGFAPIYTWYKNDVVVGSGTTFTYMPVVNNDTIIVQLTSNATCITNANAYDTLVMTVNTVTPVSVTITVNPTTPVCSGTPVTVYVTSTTGAGTAPPPVFEWQVNGVNVSGGTSYTYIPAQFDSVDCYLVTSLACGSPDTAYSNPLRMLVIPSLIDSIHIYSVPANPNLLHYLDPITFYEEDSNFGWTPTYQWYVNGVAVPGATNRSYVLTISQPSTGTKFVPFTVYCVMGTSLPCTTPTTNTKSNTITVDILTAEVPFVANGFSDVSLIPNPNKGTFRLKGMLNNTASSEVAIEITDILGKVVYKNTAQAPNGKMDMQVELGDNVANGVYYIRLSSGGESDVRHFVLEQ